MWKYLQNYINTTQKINLDIVCLACYNFSIGEINERS
jgi:hypothetical protein